MPSNVSSNMPRSQPVFVPSRSFTEHRFGQNGGRSSRTAGRCNSLFPERPESRPSAHQAPKPPDRKEGPSARPIAGTPLQVIRRWNDPTPEQQRRQEQILRTTSVPAISSEPNTEERREWSDRLGLPKSRGASPQPQHAALVGRTLSPQPSRTTSPLESLSYPKRRAGEAFGEVPRKTESGLHQEVMVRLAKRPRSVTGTSPLPDEVACQSKSLSSTPTGCPTQPAIRFEELGVRSLSSEPQGGSRRQDREAKDLGSDDPGHKAGSPAAQEAHESTNTRNRAECGGAR